MTLPERHIALDLTDLLLRRFARITLIAVLTIATALGINAVYGPSYTASVRVLVSPGAADGATIVPADHGLTARNQAELLNDHGLIAKFLPSPDAAPASRTPLLRRLAQRAGQDWRPLAVRLGLLSPASAQETLAARMTKAIIARAVGDTDVVQLDFTWDDRFFAARAVNQVLEGYQRAIARAAEARDALHQAQIRQAEAESDLSATPSQATDQAADLDHERSALQARLEISRTTADRLRLERELARRKQENAEQEYRNGGWVDGAGQEGITLHLAESFSSLLKQRQDLLSDPHASPRALRRVDAEISEVRQQNYRAVELAGTAQLDTLSERLQSAEDAIARDQTTLHRLDSQTAEADLAAQTRAARLARAADARQRTQDEASRVDAIWQEVGSTRALSGAIPPAEPDFPAPSLLVEIACALGLAAGLLSALLAERGRRTIDRPADIDRHLKIEVLARLNEAPAAQLR